MATDPLLGQHRRRVWRLAWPLILANLTVPLLGLVDTAVMGHLPDPAYLGAVALGATLFNLLFWSFGFLRMGTTGLTAQRLGAGDAPGQGLVLARSLVVATALGGLLLALHAPLIGVGLDVLGGSPEVRALAGDYAGIRMLAAPVVLAQYAVLGWLLGLGQTRGVMALMVIQNLTNIVLSLVFVVGFGWGVSGVAASSALAESATLLLGLVWCRRVLLSGGGLPPLPSLLRLRGFRELMQVNGALFVRTLCLLFAFAFFSAQGARQGDTILAANAILLQFITFSAHALDGFAHTVETLVGQSIGRSDRLAFALDTRAATDWSVAVSLVLAVAYAVLGPLAIRMLTTNPAVQQTAISALPWVVGLTLLGVWSYLLDGLFIGATRVRTLRNAMLLSVSAVYLPAWWLLQPLGNHGLWAALCLFFAARALTLAVAFRRQRAGWFASVSD